MVNGVPVAITELLLRYFGAGALPDFSESQVIASVRDPYRPLRDRLENTWEFEDLTDFQYDLGWSWWLHRGDIVRNLRLSFVGPYALILDANGTNTISDAELTGTVQSDGFVILASEELMTPVEIWAPDYAGSLYEFLFEFDRGSPWNR
jgi:hypothetical protein